MYNIYDRCSKILEDEEVPFDKKILAELIQNIILILEDNK